ncbi:MAG TPA: glycogen debranching enzyme GlgX, partial [Chitinophagaceae bacterium]|nr:glycogen debranching enzyme GlgX [Chitinophagaceae bacterium]
SMGVFLGGHGIRMIGPKGEKVTDDNFYVIFNAHFEQLEFTLPVKRFGNSWYKILDTAHDFIDESCTGDECKSGDKLMVEGRSVVLLKNPK